MLNHFCFRQGILCPKGKAFSIVNITYLDTNIKRFAETFVYHYWPIFIFRKRKVCSGISYTNIQDCVSGLFHFKSLWCPRAFVKWSGVSFPSKSIKARIPGIQICAISLLSPKGWSIDLILCKFSWLRVGCILGMLSPRILFFFFFFETFHNQLGKSTNFLELLTEQ